MDETSAAPPHPPHTPRAGGSRRIVREPEDRKIAGVCSGLADHLGVDVTVMRVTAVALAIITPAALIAYLVAAVAVPERRPDQPRVRARQVHLGHVPHPLLVVGAIVAVAVLIDDAWWLEPFPAAVALVGIGVWLVVQNRDEDSPDPYAASGAGGSPAGGAAPPVPPEGPATGPVDAGTAAGGPADAGTAGAGTVDAGTAGAGTVDAGTAGAGTVDAGAAGTGPEAAGAGTSSGTRPPWWAVGGDAASSDAAPEDAPTAQHPMAASPWVVSVSQHSNTVGDGGTTLTGEQAPGPSEPASREGAGPSGEIPPPASPWWSGNPAAPAPPATTRPVPVRPRRRRSRSGTVVVALLLVGAGSLWLLTGLDVVTVSTDVVLALGLLVVGAGLLVTSWQGRAYVLIPLGVVMAGLLVAGEVIDVPLGAGSGERTDVVDTAGDLRSRHELFAGELTVDLTDAPLPAGRTTEVEAAVGMGELRVVVPRDVVVEVTAAAGAGEVTSPGGPEANESGVRVDTSFLLDPADEPGPDADRAEGGADPGGDRPPRLALDLAVGVGAVEVTRG